MSSTVEAVTIGKPPACADGFRMDCAPADANPSNRVNARDERSLNSLTRRGAGYLALRYGLSIGLSLGNMFVLTWWIGPHAYGIFVTAVGLTTFLSSLTRFGVDTYLVRCDPAPDRREYNIASTLVLIISLVLLLAGIASVPVLEIWYSQREFALPYMVLLASIPLIGVGGIPMARLERDLNFRAVAGIELGGQFTSLAVALVLAACGARVWAPVVGFVAWQVFAFVTACIAAELWPACRFDRGVAYKMLAFGFGFSASVRTWQLRMLVNPLLVGRFAGPEGVAYVAFAIRIAEGLGFVRSAAGRIAIAALSKLQNNRDRFRGSLEQALRLQVIALGPLLCAFALCGPWVVPHFMGQRWLPGLTVYPFIAVAVLLNSVFNLQASALFVLGKQWAVMHAYTSHVVLLAGATFLLLPRFGILGYGIAELIACAGYVFLHTKLATYAPISYRRVLPWLAIFIIFMVPAITQSRRGTTTLVAGVGIVAALQRRSFLDSSGFSTSLARIVPRRLQGKFEHLLRFAFKLRARGFRYASAIARYKLNSTRYRMETLRAKGGAACDSGCACKVAVEPDITSIYEQTRAFHFEESEIASIVSSVPEELRREAIAEADRILLQRFVFRGHEETFPDRINWNARPEGNLSWTWDLNRHAFFLKLGTSFYYTGDPRYACKLRDLWCDWIARNPETSGNWSAPFEVAARLQNWIWSYFFLLHSGEVDAAGLDDFARAMRGHADYLRAHLEYHWPNNHLLLEAKALYEFAILFPERDRETSYAAYARTILEQEIESQVLPDGVHAELCSMYHRIVAGELTELSCLLERRNEALSAHLQQKIALMPSFSSAMTRHDGSVPLLGDSAEADTYIRFDTTKPYTRDLTFWVQNLPALARETDPSFKDEPRLELFPHAGYAFLNAGEGVSEVHVTFDFGAFSECTTANHGHCDALSFELYAHGRPLIVDPGVYLPWRDDAGWARHFRSTAAHNALQIDGKEQSELSSYCDVRRTAKVNALREVASSAGVAVKAECIPYWAGDGDICHRREVRLEKGRILLVHDEVMGSGKHQLQWAFQFSPDLEVTASVDGIVRGTVGPAHSVKLVPAARQIPKVCLAHGEMNPIRGWVSRNSAKAVPATVAIYRLETALPFEIDFFVDLG